MQNINEMTISELSTKSGVSVSTIRNYIQNNLVPPPIEKDKSRTFYSVNHLNRIQLIQKIRKEWKISLNKIKEIIPMLELEGDVQIIHTPLSPQQQRLQIIEAAITIFLEKGYDVTSVSDIIKSVKIGRGTFYKHFRNKKKIFLECIDTLLERNSSDINIEDVMDNGHDVNKAISRHVEKFTISSPGWRRTVSMLKAAAASHPEDFSLKLEETIQEKIGLYQEKFRKGIEKGYLRNINAKVFAVMSLGIQESCSDYLLDNPRESMEGKKLLEEVQDIILHGVLKK